jgi:hypothetical protein
MGYLLLLNSLVFRRIGALRRLNVSRDQLNSGETGEKPAHVVENSVVGVTDALPEGPGPPLGGGLPQQGSKEGMTQDDDTLLESPYLYVDSDQGQAVQWVGGRHC